MGLDQFDGIRFLRRCRADWALPAIVAGLAVAVGLTGDAGRDVLAFDRAALRHGELWRLVGAHFAHLGTSHLVLNLAGLGLVWFLLGEYLSWRRWLAVFAISVAGVDLGLWFFVPTLQWYVGLSGVLHGLLAAGVIAGLRTRRFEVWVLGAALLAKLAWEQAVGALPGSEAAAGGAVIVASHAWGALAGTVSAAILIYNSPPRGR